MENKPISVIKQMFVDGEINEKLIGQLKNDRRKGVQALLQQYEKRKQKEKQQLANFKMMLHYENEAKNKGYRTIAGVDEAGRGPLAGPVVAAAVILPDDFLLLGLDDSKKLTEKQREYFFEKIKEEAISYHIAVKSNEAIDRMNILEATKSAMYEAISGLDTKPDYVLVDAVALPKLPVSSEVVIKGDAKSISIAAASVLAKVTRDRMMQRIHEEFPMYDFKSNMGYGTKRHMESIKTYGVSPYHRKTFAPIRNIIGQ